MLGLVDPTRVATDEGGAIIGWLNLRHLGKVVFNV
jgi:hypothetical protein